MAIESFELKTLTEIDGGRIREAFEQALRRCESDCRDRPNIAKARTLTLSVSLVPAVDERGELDTVAATFDIAEKLPKRQSRKYQMLARGGKLLFNELSPDDVKQKTLDEAPRPRKTSDAR